MKYIRKIETYLKLILLMLIILYINVGTVLICNNIIDYLKFSKILSYFGLATLIVYIIDKILHKDKIKLKDIIILLLGIFGYISYKYAYDPSVALYGTVGRNEGLLCLLTYYIIFLLSSTINEKHRKIIMFTLITTGIFQISIGTIQILKITNIFGYDRSNNWSMVFLKMASGTVGNPNFYSAYILICLAYLYSKLLKKHKKIFTYIIYLILTVIFSYGLIIGHTLGCIISFILVFIITNIVAFIKGDKQKRKTTIITVVVLIGITLGMVYFNKDLNQLMKKNYIEIKEILKDGINETTGNSRILVWKETIKYVPKHIYNGIGIDNFRYIVDGEMMYFRVDDMHQSFDKVHNEFLQKLITEGIFSFATYIILLIYVVISYLLHDKKENYPYFIAIIAYLINSFVGISVITVAPIFYMMMGFTSYKKKEVIANE